MFRYHWSITIMIVSSGALLGALILQFGFDVAVCKLCYHQRYLWLATFMAACLAWLFKHQKSYLMVLFLTTILLLLASFGMGIYQTGTIYGWWREVITCEATSVDFDALHAFNPLNTDNLSFTPLCSNADQLIFGIPISLLNAFIAIICLFYLAFYIKFIYLKKLNDKN